MATALDRRTALAFSARRRKRQEPPKPPAEWAKENGIHLWSLQVEVAESVAKNKRTVVRSCAGIGKSFLSAAIVCWWVATHPVNEVYVWTTAPGNDQVSGILWGEIRRLHEQLKLPGRVTLDNKWWIGSRLVASGRKPADKAKGSDDDPDTGQGFHARYLLVVLDDAGGLDGWLWDAAENITTGDDCRILATGNPDHAGSRFAQVCKHQLWTHFKASFFDSPNATGEWIPERLRHVLQSKTWAADRLADWGKDDRRYLSKVLAEFPKDHPDQVIPAAALAECCLAVPRSKAELEPVALGVDVGGGSDLTVIRERRGMKAGRRWAIRTSDSEEAARLVVKAVQESGAAMVNVDANGVGWALCGLVKVGLRAAGLGHVTVHGVMVGAASSLPLVYGNLKAEMWFVIGRDGSRNHEWDLSGMAEAETVKTELLAPRWRQDAKGRIFIEEKADVIARTGHSPDDADSLLLAYYVPKDGQGAYWQALQAGRLR